MTALVILVTGVHTSDETGAVLTALAFDTGLPGKGGFIVATGIVLFAFSTAISWSYYGDRSVEYLFGPRLGPRMVMPYRVLFCILLPVGAATELTTVWTLSDITNALMAWPNLVALLGLSPLVVRLTREYFSDPNRVAGVRS